MKGNLFVISGPSGVGKDTLMALLLKRIPQLSKWVTCTTRIAREGELEGVDYFFKTHEEFQNMLSNNELVEWNQFANNYYGTPKKFVKDKLAAGESIVTLIDVNGALNVKKFFPKAHLIFVEPPSIDVLKQRLLNRGTEDIKEINERIRICENELEQKSKFDVSIVNDKLDQSYEELSNYIYTYINGK